MGKKTAALTFSPNLSRLAFPEDEPRLDWLPGLLDAYHVADQGVSRAISEQETSKRKLACARGCATCCITHRSIPVYPIELVGITWYATEKLEGPLRTALMERLAGHAPGDPCVFLVDGACAIHPMRPLACRHFNVLGSPCAPGEDAYFTRRKDVIRPIREYMDEAFFHMLPFYGIRKAGDRRKIIKKGQHHDAAKELQSMNWGQLATRMRMFDAS